MKNQPTPKQNKREAAKIAAAKKEAFGRAIGFFGNQTSMAKALNIRQATVSNWSHGLYPVPAEYALEIHRLTEGTVRAEEVRPDLPWHLVA